MGPGKAYVKGYEIETIGTTFVDLNKAREFNTQNNFITKFDVGNYVNVTNVYGTPDIGFVSGDTEAFKRINLYSKATTARGTENAGLTSGLNTIGRAKSKGFEYVTGAASAFVFANASSTSAIYKHYLFDINLFTHLNIQTAQAFTTGEKVTGSTSGATATVESITNVETVAITGMTVANPSIVTCTGHKFRDGQQVTISGTTGLTIDSAVATATTVFTVRNPGVNTFSLFGSDGTTSQNVTAYTSGGSAAHGLVVTSSVGGTFTAGETITGGTSGNTAVIQNDRIGFKGANHYDFSSVKQLGMAGTPAYTSDVARSASYGESLQITGTLTVANSATAVTGFGTNFTTELQIDDEVTILNDAGGTVTRTVESIQSNTSLQLASAVGGSDVSTKTIATRNRGKLQDSNKNVSIFPLPQSTVKTLKTTSNASLTDTNFTVRRHFVQ